MESIPLLDRAGRRRSPATTSSFHQGVPPRNKGLRYPPDPPSVEEIIAVMRAAGDGPDGVRLRGVIVVLWRAGLRISEALALNETDLDPDRGALLVRHGKGDKRREVGMDRWAWSHLEPWLELRTTLPVGRLFCVVRGPTRGRPCAPAGIREQLHHAAARGRGPSPVRAASAAARACGRDVARGDLADRDPAPARSRRSRDHIPIPARNRQHRDHPSRPPATRTDDPRRSATPARALIAIRFLTTQAPCEAAGRVAASRAPRGAQKQTRGDRHRRETATRSSPKEARAVRRVVDECDRSGACCPGTAGTQSQVAAAPVALGETDGASRRCRRQVRGAYRLCSMQSLPSGSAKNAI